MKMAEGYRSKILNYLFGGPSSIRGNMTTNGNTPVSPIEQINEKFVSSDKKNDSVQPIQQINEKFVSSDKKNDSVQPIQKINEQSEANEVKDSMCLIT